MRIGIYGGSFNPVHKGHIHLVRTAKIDFELDLIYLVPSRISPHRSSAEYVSGRDRMEMLRLACKNEDGIEVCSYELENDRVSYSVYTVEYFRRRFPNDELFLLVGSDMLMCFDSWYRFQDILSEAAVCVVSRNEGDIEELRKKAEKLRKFGNIFISSSLPEVISSSYIRKKIAKNENFTCYLDENVVQYIRSGGLYSPTHQKS